jgi:orotate phosphoribosyltransferase
VVTVATILNPHSSAVESDVFIDESKAKTNAGVVRTVSSLAAARKAVEHDVSFVFGYAVAVVLDTDLDHVFDSFDGD